VVDRAFGEQPERSPFDVGLHLTPLARSISHATSPSRPDSTHRVSWQIMSQKVASSAAAALACGGGQGVRVIVENDVMVPMRDGVRLRADVFRPAAGGPHPVLVQRYPYSTRNGFMNLMGQQMAMQGYAVVVQSCRGRFGSEGHFSPFHPDVDDSYDT